LPATKTPTLLEQARRFQEHLDAVEARWWISQALRRPDCLNPPS